MKNFEETKKIFQKFTGDIITDQTAEEIEKNLKEFFDTLLCWSYKTEGEDNV